MFTKKKVIIKNTVWNPVICDVTTSVKKYNAMRSNSETKANVIKSKILVLLFKPKNSDRGSLVKNMAIKLKIPSF